MTKKQEEQMRIASAMDEHGREERFLNEIESYYDVNTGPPWHEANELADADGSYTTYYNVCFLGVQIALERAGIA